MTLMSLMATLGMETGPFKEGARDAKAEMRSLESAASDTAATFQGTLGTAFADSIADVSRLGEKFTAVGGILTASFTAPIVAAGAAGLHAGMELDSAFDNIRTKTGQTGQSLEALQASFRNVFAGVASNADQVSEAITVLSQRTTQTGPGLDQLASQFLELSNITGQRLTPMLENATRLFGDWNIKASEQGPTMDMLYRVSQQLGIGFNDLTQKVVQAGAPFRGLGLDLEQAAVMVGRFQAEGVNTELVLGAMKAALNRFGAAGREPVEAFQMLINSIRDTDVAHGNLIAQQVVGQRRMADFADAVRQGKFDIDDLVQSVRTSKETIHGATSETEDFAEGWQRFKNQMVLALEPLGGTLFTILNDLTPKLRGIVEVVTSAARSFGELPAPAREAIVGVAALAAATGPVVLGMGAIIGKIPQIRAGLDAMGLTFTTVTGQVGGLSSKLALAPPLIAAFLGAWASSGSLRDLETNLSQLKRNLEDLFSPLGFLQTKFNEAAAGARAFAERIGLGSLIESLAPTWDRLGGMVDGFRRKIVDAARSMDPDFMTILRDSLSPVGALNRAFAQMNQTVDDLRGALGLKTTAMRTMDEAARNAADTLQNRVHGSMVQAGIAAGGLKTSTDLAAEAAERLRRQTGATGDGLDNHKEKVDEAKRAYERLQNAVKSAQDSHELFMSKFNGATWDFGQFQQFVQHGGNVKTALTQIDTELIKLRQKFGDDIPPAIGGTIVQLTLAKGKLQEFQNTANELKLETAFEKLNAEMAKMAPKLREIPPIIAAIPREIVNSELEFERLNQSVQNASRPITQLPPAIQAVSDAAAAAARENGRVWREFSDDMVRIGRNLNHDFAAAVVDLWSGKGWDGFKDAGLNALKAVGDKIVEIGVDYVEGILAKHLKDIVTDIIPDLTHAFTRLGSFLLDLFQNVGSSIVNAVKGAGNFIGGLFGGGVDGVNHNNAGPGNIPTGGSPTGGIEGAVGSAASAGVAGIVTAVASVATAVTGVMSFIQGMHQSADLGRIEENTRFTQIALIGPNGVIHYMNTFLPKLEGFENFNYGVVAPGLAGIENEIVNKGLGIWGSVDALKDIAIQAKDILHDIFMHSVEQTEAVNSQGDDLEAVSAASGETVKKLQDVVESSGESLKEMQDASYYAGKTASASETAARWVEEIARGVNMTYQVISEEIFYHTRDMQVGINQLTSSFMPSVVDSLTGIGEQVAELVRSASMSSMMSLMQQIADATNTTYQVLSEEIFYHTRDLQIGMNRLTQTQMPQLMTLIGDMALMITDSVRGVTPGLTTLFQQQANELRNFATLANPNNAFMNLGTLLNAQFNALNSNLITLANVSRVQPVQQPPTIINNNFNGFTSNNIASTLRSQGVLF